MNQPIFPAAAVLALIALSACDANSNQAMVVDTVAPDPMATQLANAAPVELPPAMTASVTFRCKDNSLIYVDFFKGEKQVTVRTDKTASPTLLKAPEAGQPYTADSGYALEGTAKAVTVTVPGKGEKSCKA
jgi:hypothetical protein